MSELPIVILMAEDDPDDRLLTQRALWEYRLRNGVRFVENGKELLDYLRHQGKYADPSIAPRPDLVLLDLNMPHMDGREALREIKADPQLRSIPVVVLTTSQAEEDVLRSYDLGANSYITKPVTFEGLARVIRALDMYWFQIVRLPNAQRAAAADTSGRRSPPAAPSAGADAPTATPADQRPAPPPPPAT
jgi:two-component system response regulator